MQAQKPGEANIAFTYDVMGRVLSQTLALGTANQAVNTYLYHFANGPASPAWVEVTDAEGKRYALRYDGAGRTVSAAQLAPSSEERRIKALIYDLLGNKSAETVYDQLEDRELTLQTRYEYNGWNELARTVRPDGSVILSERDMIANTLTTGVQGLNTTINRYNKFNKVEEVTQVSTTGARLKTLERGYDGFGRCNFATNVYDHRTDYAYDAFDRIREISMQPADGTSARTVSVSYADFSNAQLPTEISANGTVLGRRGYDGIGRMISTANGGAAPWTYEYNGQAMQPSSSTSPRGIRLNYRYNNDLGTLVEIISPSNGACGFTHDPVTGQVTNSTNNTAERQDAYDDYGYQKSERVTAANVSSEASYATSPAGRPLRVTTTEGGTLAQRYDDAGRPTGSAGEGFTEEITYDSFGRVVSVRVSLAGITLETALTFDSFGREETRALRLEGNTLETIRRNYSASGQLSERKTTGATGILVSHETFAYDAYSRWKSGER